jgi:hypothetical protein
MSELSKKVVCILLWLTILLSVGAFFARESYTPPYDANIALLQENACRRELSISEGVERTVPLYEVVDGKREGSRKQVLFVINNTNAVDWTSSDSDVPLAFAFAFDNGKDACLAYVLKGGKVRKLDPGLSSIRSVVDMINRHNGMVDQCRDR